MSVERRVLLVSPTAAVSKAVAGYIRRAGYHLTVVKTFQTAKAQLQQHRPDFFISELKLAEYNGLQLALRARTMGIPAVVLADPSFESDVELVGAVRLSADHASTEELPALMMRLLQDPFATHSPYPWYDAAQAEPTVAPRPEFRAPSTTLH